MKFAEIQTRFQIMGGTGSLALRWSGALRLITDVDVTLNGVKTYKELVEMTKDFGRSKAFIRAEFRAKLYGT